MSLPTVKVFFKDSAYDYTTAVAYDVDREQARDYFVGETFDVGVFPQEKRLVCVAIKFTPGTQK